MKIGLTGITTDIRPTIFLCAKLLIIDITTTRLAKLDSLTAYVEIADLRQICKVPLFTCTAQLATFSWKELDSVLSVRKSSERHNMSQWNHLVRLIKEKHPIAWDNPTIADCPDCKTPIAGHLGSIMPCPHCRKLLRRADCGVWTHFFP